MAAPTGVFVMKDANVTVDAVQYTNQCTRARLVPQAEIQTVRTLVPDGVVQDVDSPVWTLEITCLQKNNAGGLVKALRAASPGDELAITLAPKVLTGEDEATFTVLAVPAPFGGDQGSYPTAELVFPVIGQPVFTAQV